jgi:hypothetical protein
MLLLLVMLLLLPNHMIHNQFFISNHINDIIPTACYNPAVTMNAMIYYVLFYIQEPTLHIQYEPAFPCCFVDSRPCVTGDFNQDQPTS